MRIFLVLTLVIFSSMCASNNTSNNGENSSTSSSSNSASSSVPIPIYQPTVVREFPHDSNAFTQGLSWYQGALYEGTGGSKQRMDPFETTLRKVDLDSGRVLKETAPPEDIFGEGIAILNDKIYQLSWHAGKAFRYNLADFKFEKEFKYEGEGWGLTTDGKQLIQTDKTNRLRFIDPETFATMRTIDVFDEDGNAVDGINELEWINGEIWANVWQTNEILRISPADGRVLGVVDLSEIADDEMSKTPDADVLNGIAYDADSGRLFITGKKWSRLFEIKVGDMSS